jgi:hypothetical protein
VASLGCGHAGVQLPKSKRCVKGEKVAMRAAFMKTMIQLTLENVRSGQRGHFRPCCSSCGEHDKISLRAFLSKSFHEKAG